MRTIISLMEPGSKATHCHRHQEKIDTQTSSSTFSLLIVQSKRKVKLERGNYSWWIEEAAAHGVSIRRMREQAVLPLIAHPFLKVAAHRSGARELVSQSVPNKFWDDTLLSPSLRLIREHKTAKKVRPKPPPPPAPYLTRSPTWNAEEWQPQ